MTFPHKLSVLLVAMCLFIGCGVLACKMDVEHREEVQLEEVKEYTKMDCEFLGDADSSKWYYAGVFYCKDKTRNACFYIVSTDGGGVVMNAAPCFGESWEDWEKE